MTHRSGFPGPRPEFELLSGARLPADLVREARPLAFYHRRYRSLRSLSKHRSGIWPQI